MLETIDFLFKTIRIKSKNDTHFHFILRIICPNKGFKMLLMYLRERQSSQKKTIGTLCLVIAHPLLERLLKKL